jgi:hypothetical protein
MRVLREIPWVASLFFKLRNTPDDKVRQCICKTTAWSSRLINIYNVWDTLPQSSMPGNRHGVSFFFDGEEFKGIAPTVQKVSNKLY